MKTSPYSRDASRSVVLGILALFVSQSALAHVSYNGRDFGIFEGDGLDLPMTIFEQTVSSSFGWADATDGDYGDSHRTRAFRFTLNRESLVTIDVQGSPGFSPGFSVYAGLTHVAPAASDHDAEPVSVAYLNGLGTGAKEGSFFALGDWAIGNSDGLLSYLTYVGHAVDGTSANYGSAPGINGDGLADQFVRATFALPAGNYSIFIGGADYGAQGPGPYTSYSVTPTVAVVPEPACGVLGVMAVMALAGRRRRLGVRW
jgi:hypothetical protein